MELQIKKSYEQKTDMLPGSILESNGMCMIFQKGKKTAKKARYLKIWGKMYKI